MEVYRVDLGEWVAGRRWRALLDLVDGLPPASRLREAIFNDPVEAAKIVAEQRAAEDADLEQTMAASAGISPAELRARLSLDDDEDDDLDVDDPGRPRGGRALVWRPRQSEWDLPAIQLAAIHASLVDLSAKVLRPEGHRAPPASAYLPAPRTLVDDLRDAMERDDYRASQAVFAPSVQV